jgi:ATP-dependent RNA helicase DeaD
MLRGARIEAEWIKAPTAADIQAKDQDRLIEALLAPVEVDEDDLALGAKLLAERSPEEIAAALVRMHRAKMPVAADMLDDGNREKMKDNHRAGFDDSVWFKMNVGRRNNADPKWILPLLCRRGGVTKNDIGAIRISPDETHFGISAAAAARFAKAVAQPGHDEDNDVEIIQAKGPPQPLSRDPKRNGKGAPNAGQVRPSPKPFGGPRRDGPNASGGGNRPFRKDGPAPSKHGVKHKAKGNRPR